jgi:hypothetical protein
VVPDGFGIGYMVDDDVIGCNVTSYASYSDVDGFMDCLKSSLDDMFAVLTGHDFTKTVGSKRATWNQSASIEQSFYD